MSGRPPRYNEGGGDEDEEYDEEQGGYQDEEHGEEQEQHEEGEEGEEGEERAESPMSGGDEGEEAIEFVPAPAEKEFPQYYQIDIGASSSVRAPSSLTVKSDDSSSSSTEQNKQPSSNPRKLFVSMDDPIHLPKWLHYILNDDFASLSYLIHPPPGAEINFPDNNNKKDDDKKKKKSRAGGSGGEYDDEEDESGYDSEGNSRPTSSRDGGGGGGDSELSGSDGGEGGRHHHNRHREEEQELPFHPNQRFILVPSLEKSDQNWNLFPWEPPVKKSNKHHHRPGSAGSEGDSSVSARSGDEGFNNNEEDGNNTPGDENFGSPSSQQYGRGGDVEDDEDDENKGAFVVDVLTLAAMFSPQSLEMCIRERLPLIKYDFPPRPRVLDEDGQEIEQHTSSHQEEGEEEDEDLIMLKKKKVAPILTMFWKWCENFGGLYNDSCYPLQQLIKACSEFQTSPVEEKKKSSKKHQEKKNNEEDDEENDENENEEEDDEQEQQQQEQFEESNEDGSPLTLAQKRRMYFDYTSLFEAIVNAPSTRQAQFLEQTMKQMLIDSNICPLKGLLMQDIPASFKPQPVSSSTSSHSNNNNKSTTQKHTTATTVGPTPATALRNINAIHAYLTFMECIPKSIVTGISSVNNSTAKMLLGGNSSPQSQQTNWTEPTPLTEAEVAKYPEGAENIPEEHPPVVLPLFWKFLQHIRRRAAKEKHSHSEPKRPLVEILKKMLTPSSENLSDDDPKPVPTIHNEEAGTDFLLSTLHNTGRNYPPSLVEMYLTDLMMICLSRHEFGNEALEWLGEMKRSFPVAKWKPVGSSHLLAMSINRMPKLCAMTSISKLLQAQWFAPADRIDYQTFVLEVTSDPAIRPLDTGVFRDDEIVQTFGKKFCQVFLDNLCDLEGEKEKEQKQKQQQQKENNNENDNNKRPQSALSQQSQSSAASSSSARVNSPSNNNKTPIILRDVLPMLETECPPLFSELTKIKNVSQKFLDLITSTPSSTFDDRERISSTPSDFVQQLDGFETEIGSTYLATPKMLRAAVDSKQLEAVSWLVTRGVSKVDHSRGEVAAMEYCVESKNSEVLMLLIEQYGDVHAPICGGNGSILFSVQKAFNSETIQKIEAVSKDAQHHRGADPTQQLGVKIGSIV